MSSTLEKQTEDKRLAEGAHRQQQAPGLAPQRSVAAAGLAAAARTACYAAQLAQVVLEAVDTLKPYNVRGRPLGDSWGNRGIIDHS